MTIRLHLRAACLALMYCVAAVSRAQEPPCGLRTVTQTAKLMYPPIARAAHVSGVVVVRTDFAKDGSVIATEAWSGPQMLRANAVSFVKGLRANDYGGSRSCPIAVAFQMDDTLPRDAQGDQLAYVDARSSGDVQHYVIAGKTVAVYSMTRDRSGKMVPQKLRGIY